MNIDKQMTSAVRHLKKEIKEISPQVIQYAKGIVFLTMVKGAFIWSGSLSTGIVVKRLSPTTWSPPVSVGMASVGFGLQAGGQKVDIIIIIGDDEEIDAFCGTGQLKLGVEYGLAAGPIGRDIDLSAYIGGNGLACSMYYSRSKGLFAGFSLEGAVLLSRWTANKSFYGGKVSVKDVLNGKVNIPSSKKSFVEEFHRTLVDFEVGRLETRIATGQSSSSSSTPPSSSAALLREEEEEEEQEQQELLLTFSTMGETGKNILKESLEQGCPQVVFFLDHVVDESDPVNKTYNIISVKAGTPAIIVEGTLDKGLGGQLTDYVRVKVNEAGGGRQREGLVSRHVLK